MITCCREPDIYVVCHCPDCDDNSTLNPEDDDCGNVGVSHTVCRNCDSGTCPEC